MSANVKYRLEARSRKYNDVYRVDIHEDGYIGLNPTYKNIGAGKLVLVKTGGVIQTTSFRISINADRNFEYIGFFQYNARKYSVKLYKNGTQIGSYYIVPESYQEPYINPPYAVGVIATDGLGFLENYTFDNDGLQTRLQAIKHCLDNLGHDIGYSIAIDLYEDSMDNSKSMLAEAYFYGDIFNGEKCNEVLEKLLPFGATITQHNNRWLIRRPYEDAEKTHFLYTSAGVYEGTQTGETVLIMGDLLSQGIWPHGSALLTMEHAWKNAIIRKNYGKKESFLRNHKFEIGESYWTDATNDAFRVRKLDETYYAQLLGYVSPGSDLYIEQGVDVESTPDGDAFVFECNYDALGYNKIAIFTNIHPVTLTIRIQVKLGSYYLTTSGWTTTATIMEFEIESSVGPIDWKRLKIITNNIPVSGTMIVRLYRLEYPEELVGKHKVINGSVFTDIKVYSLRILEYTDPEEIPVDIRENAPTIGTVIELKPTDIPNISNTKLLFANGNLTSDGNIAQLWSNNGENPISFEDVIKFQLLNYYGNPLRIISGCFWRGKGLHLNAVAKHPMNYNKQFIADSGEWEILNDRCNIKWIEKPGSASDGPIWIVEDGIWDDEGEIWIEEKTWNDTNPNIIEITINHSNDYDLTSYFSSGDTILSIPDNSPGVGGVLKADGVTLDSGDLPFILTTQTIVFNANNLIATTSEATFNAMISGTEKVFDITISLPL